MSFIQTGPSPALDWRLYVERHKVDQMTMVTPFSAMAELVA
jgi:hypothetical protein